jgi:arylsulfatase A-like enzyme
MPIDSFFIILKKLENPIFMNFCRNCFFQNGVIAGLTTLISLSLYGNKQDDNRKTPDIILILADDLGFGDLSCQGATDIKTPNIDRIFSNGMKFTNFYANSTVSSPTRASLMTGRYPDMVGVPGVIRTHPEDSWGYLTREAVLLPQKLKEAGYHTALIGKWHLGLEAPNLPNQRGFDYFHGFLGDMMDDYYTHLRFKNNYMRENDREIKPEGHATDLFANWSVQYLKKRQQEKEPFFLYLAFNAPHDPLQPPEEWLQKVRNREKGISGKRTKLVALIEHMDWNIGRVMEQLEKSGQINNTLVIFTSDNGGLLASEASNGPYRGGKQDMYEGGIRVPAAFMWKKRIIPGSVFSGLSLTMDIFPTLCDIAGVKISHAVDGISLLPGLTGQKQETDNRTVFFVRREGNMKYGGMAYYASRSADYKIVQNTPWEPMQFFNLKEDPYETKPLEKTGKEYETLFRQLMEHIRLSGVVPWEKE